MIKYFLKKLKALICVGCVIFVCAAFTGCYSVFSGGTGGTVVDAESNANPKTGIANVDVYAYTSSSDRDADYNRWSKGTKAQPFTPQAEYYGHTSTGNDGSWSISKLIWKENAFKSSFGKDADYTKIYMIFYHADYGCQKEERIIMSDNSSDYSVTEMTSIVKRTSITLNFIDAKTQSQTNQAVFVEVTVPQNTDAGSDLADKVYSQTITGSGSLTIRYPRYKTEEGASGLPTYTNTGIENTPTVYVNYYQAREPDFVEWKGCKNGQEDGDYSFYTNEIGYGEGKKGVERSVLNSPYTFNFYGKSIKHALPAVSGTVGDTSSAESDGLHLFLKGVDADGAFTVDYGETYTTTQARGNNGNQTHGYFSGLGGSSHFWMDSSYTGRYSSTKVQLQKEDGTVLKEFVLRSDKDSEVLTIN